MIEVHNLLWLSNGKSIGDYITNNDYLEGSYKADGKTIDYYLVRMEFSPRLIIVTPSGDVQSLYLQLIGLPGVQDHIVKYVKRQKQKQEDLLRQQQRAQALAQLDERHPDLPNDLKLMVQSLDWYYDYSDDINAWRRGKETHAKAQSLLKEHNSNYYQEYFNLFIKK